MNGEKLHRFTRATLALLLLAFLTGCSGAADEAGVSDDDGNGQAQAAGGAFPGSAERAEDAADTQAAAPAAGESGDSVAEPGAEDLGPLPVSAGRRVIRTAELVLEVDDPAAAAEEVVVIATRAGGFVAETDLQRDREGVVSGTITLRVPSSALNDTVNELDALGDAVPLRRIDETDVTAETTDLEAQRNNLAAYEDELRSLLSDVRETTDRPDDLLTVFERIRQVRGEIDRIDARLAVLTDQVALSTIVVTVEPSSAGVFLADPTWAPADTVRHALASTARALTGIADAVIWVILTALPIVMVIGAPVIAAVALWRRGRRTGAATAPATPSPDA